MPQHPLTPAATRHLATQMCAAMHCGTDDELDRLRRTLAGAFGESAWVILTAVLAEFADAAAPPAARDLTGAVLPHLVLELGDEKEARQDLLDAGMPPARLEQALACRRQAITCAAYALACIHLDEGEALLASLEQARERDLETLVAASSLLLRLVAEFFECPRHAPA